VGELSARLRRLLARAVGRPRPLPGPPAYLFFCVNGAGLGHLNRCLAIARRVARLQPEADICFLTSCRMLEVIAREGYVPYHIPPLAAYGGRMKARYWDRMLHTQIRLIVEHHRPTTFVYDGIALYPGLRRALQTCRFERSAMILRLRHIHTQPEQLSQGLRLFDRIIHPGEAGEARSGLPSPTAPLQPHRVAPILHFDRAEILPRVEARRRLGLPMDRRVVYLQLGSGNIDDAGTWTSHALELLARDPDLEVVLAQSPIAEQEMTPPPGVHLIRQYPNARFFNAFDLAISAAGYNTVHELLFFEVPAILIPMPRLTDDQEGRARAVERAGAAMVVSRPEDLAPALDHLLDDDARARLRDAAKRLIPENGAHEAAHLISDRGWAGGGAPETSARPISPTAS
jgi:UDP-N-acetylglucosamine--N-acetylmuramyl-(pentapeptide) pyrophosphoryl-undecaprenol N-acetylglucosamine transferase